MVCPSAAPALSWYRPAGSAGRVDTASKQTAAMILRFPMAGSNASGLYERVRPQVGHHGAHRTRSRRRATSPNRAGVAGQSVYLKLRLSDWGSGHTPKVE